jgi:methylated-DNA-[protein]-cysteine S-methyltransferase
MARLRDSAVATVPAARTFAVSALSQPTRLYVHYLETPIGLLTLAVNRRAAVVSIDFGKRETWAANTQIELNKYACGDLALQIEDYFAGRRNSFDVELAPKGTEFQLSVWERLLKLGFGGTVSYSELARRLGRRGAARAVASAVASNPIPLIVPCHRVINANGKLGKYALHHVPEERGTEMKRYLLKLEGLRFDESAPDIVVSTQR